MKWSELKEFKYGEKVVIVESPPPVGGSFYNGTTGIIIGVQNCGYRDPNSNRELLSYLVKLKYSEQWFLETNLELCMDNI